MTKSYFSLVNLDQHRRHRRREDVKPDALAKQHFARVKYLAQQSAVVLRDHEQQRAGGCRKTPDPAQEGALQAIGKRQPWRLAELQLALAARQLNQRERIACRLVQKTMTQIQREIGRLGVEQPFGRGRAEP